MTSTERLVCVILFLIALLLLAGAYSAKADGMIQQPRPVPYQQQWNGVPYHIYRDGNYFFCPTPDYDPYCQLPDDYSWALYGRPVEAQPRQDFGMEAERERLIRQGEAYCQRFPQDTHCPR